MLPALPDTVVNTRLSALPNSVGNRDTVVNTRLSALPNSVGNKDTVVNTRLSALPNSVGNQGFGLKSEEDRTAGRSSPNLNVQGAVRARLQVTG